MAGWCWYSGRPIKFWEISTFKKSSQAKVYRPALFFSLFSILSLENLYHKILLDYFYHQIKVVPIWCMVDVVMMVFVGFGRGGVCWIWWWWYSVGLMYGGCPFWALSDWWWSQASNALSKTQTHVVCCLHSMRHWSLHHPVCAFEWQVFVHNVYIGQFFIGPRYTWGPINGSECL